MHAAVGDAHVGPEIWLCKNWRTVNRCTQPPHQDNSKVTSCQVKDFEGNRKWFEWPQADWWFFTAKLLSSCRQGLSIKLCYNNFSNLNPQIVHATEGSFNSPRQAGVSALQNFLWLLGDKVSPLRCVLPFSSLFPQKLSVGCENISMRLLRKLHNRMLTINCSVSSSKIKTNTTSVSVVMTSWVSLTTRQNINFITNSSDELPWQILTGTQWQVCKNHRKFQTNHSTNICIPSFCHIPEAMQELKQNVGQHSE